MRQEAASSLRRQACLEAEEAAELARSTAAQVWNELWIKSRKQRGCLAKLPERGSPGGGEREILRSGGGSGCRRVHAVRF